MAVFCQEDLGSFDGLRDLLLLCSQLLIQGLEKKCKKESKQLNAAVKKRAEVKPQGLPSALLYLLL